MRIISGKFKGRKLVSFPNKNIRPTSDRAKEMIFSTLHSILKKKQKSFDKLKILDCFCGMRDESEESSGRRSDGQGSRNDLSDYGRIPDTV